MPDMDHMPTALNNRDNDQESSIGYTGLDPLAQIPYTGSDTLSDNIWKRVGNTLDNIVNHVGYTIRNVGQHGNAGSHLVRGMTHPRYSRRKILAIGTLAAGTSVISGSGLPILANIVNQPQQPVAQSAAREDLEGRVAQSTSAITNAVIHLGTGNVAYADGSVTLDWDIPNGHVYKQANGQGGSGNTGFTVKNDANGNFWTWYQRLGGSQSVGYPISQPFEWKGFKVQAFQKLILQWRPELGVAYAVNTLDEMSNAGKDSWLRDARMTPPSQDWSSDNGKPWSEIERNHLNLLEQNPKIKAVYYSVADPMNVFGLPMSYARVGDAYVLRTQRAVFQQWLIDVPWANAGQVVIANGGDIAKESGIIAGSYLNPIVVEGQQPQSIQQVVSAQVPTGIEITGPPDFVQYINDALNLLKTGDGKWYRYVDEGIWIVRYVENNQGIHLRGPPTNGEFEIIYPSERYKYGSSPESGVNKSILPYHAARILLHEAAHAHRDVMDNEDKADAVAKQAICEIAKRNNVKEVLSAPWLGNGHCP